MKPVYTLMSLFLAVLCSCSSQDEPQMSGSPANPKGDVVEWSIDMELPDDLTTRAAGQASNGSDGLYSFSRDINKLWYAVYYNNEFIYDCNSTGAPQVTKVGDTFNLTMKVSQNWDQTKVRLFFWAGNADDNITLKDESSATGGINLNFRQRSVSVDPKYLNGDGAIAEYDSYCGYFQLATTNNPTNFDLKFTLKRPFAQIHILSDLYTRTTYSSGIQVIPGFGRSAASASNMGSEMVIPTTWFFDSSTSMNPAYRQGEYIYSQSNYEFSNDLGGSWPSKTSFSGRDFHYLGCLLTFAPGSDVPTLQGAQASGSTAAYSKLNIAVRGTGQAVSSSSFMSVDIPAASGIHANNRYVVYNKYVPPAPDPYIDVLSVSPESASYTGGDVVIKVKSNEVPTYSGLDDWITFKQSNRSDDITTFTFTVKENSNNSARNSIITFRNGSLSATANVKQEANPNVEPEPGPNPPAESYLEILSVEPSSLRYDDTVVTVKVQSSEIPDYFINNDWINFRDRVVSGDIYTFTFNVKDNTEENARSTSIVFKNGDHTESTTIEQQAKPIPPTPDEDVFVITINTNPDWGDDGTLSF